MSEDQSGDPPDLAEPLFSIGEVADLALAALGRPSEQPSVKEWQRKLSRMVDDYRRRKAAEATIGIAVLDELRAVHEAAERLADELGSITSPDRPEVERASGAWSVLKRYGYGDDRRLLDRDISAIRRLRDCTQNAVATLERKQKATGSRKKRKAAHAADSLVMHLSVHEAGQYAAPPSLGYLAVHVTKLWSEITGKKFMRGSHLNDIWRDTVNQQEQTRREAQRARHQWIEKVIKHVEPSANRGMIWAAHDQVLSALKHQLAFESERALKTKGKIRSSRQSPA